MVLHGSASYKLLIASLLLTSSRILHTLLHQDEIQRRIPTIVHPWYVHQLKQAASRTYSRTDPESLEWCKFDDEYRTKLDRHPYVSLSREKRLADQARSTKDADAVKDGPQPGEASKDEQTQDKTSSTASVVPSAASVAGNAEYEFDSDLSNEDIEIPEGSLFDYNIPGVLKAEEVAKLDLDHWKLLVRNMLIDFEVRFIPLFQP